MSATPHPIFSYKLVLSDPDRALTVARSMGNPWTRCQSLASVAKHAPLSLPQRIELLREAFEAADHCKDPNRIVTAAAEPLEVLCILGQAETLKNEISRLLEIIDREPHPVRRQDALFWVLKMILRGKGPVEIVEKTLVSFIKASRAGHGWKRNRNLRDMAELLQPADSGKALMLVQMIEKPQVRRQALRRTGRKE